MNNTLAEYLNYTTTYSVPSVFNQPSMAFRAVAVRVVEEFLIIFRNHGPMLHAINAGARWAIEGSPKLFEAM
jgi:hypothetical protein